MKLSKKEVFVFEKTIKDLVSTKSKKKTRKKRLLFFVKKLRNTPVGLWKKQKMKDTTIYRLTLNNFIVDIVYKGILKKWGQGGLGLFGGGNTYLYKFIINVYDSRRKPTKNKKPGLLIFTKKEKNEVYCGGFGDTFKYKKGIITKLFLTIHHKKRKLK